MPPEPIDRNLFEMGDEERAAAGIEALPGSLLEAIRAFEDDDFIKGVLGEDLSEKYVKAKTKEYADYRRQITDWEISRYLHVI